MVIEAQFSGLQDSLAQENQLSLMLPKIGYIRAGAPPLSLMETMCVMVSARIWDSAFKTG